MKCVALLAALVSLASASPLKRESGPACTLVVTPADGTKPISGSVQLTYGVLVRFGQSTYPSGTTKGNTQLIRGTTVTDNGDGTYNAAFTIGADGLTSDQIAGIIEDQWSQTWVWAEDSSPGYNWFIQSASC